MTANIVIKRNKKNTAVDVENIDDENSKELIKNLHEKVFFNQKVYCRGLRLLESPEKEAENANSDAKTTKEPEKVTLQPTPEKVSKGEPKKCNTEPTPGKTIPGLSEEEIKKAKKKADRKKKEEKKKTEEPKVKGMKQKDFLKEKDEEYKFDDLENEINISDDETPTNEGFFTFSPLEEDDNVDMLLSPANFASRFAKQHHKEEMWKKSITPTGSKRGASPTDHSERRIRAKSISQIPLLEWRESIEL